MKKILWLFLAALMIVPLLACTQTVQAGELKSNKPRLTPAVSASDMSGLVTGNSAFAFDLYQLAREGDGNLFFSPYSISQALAMTWAGARGMTAQQMASALRFTLSSDRLHPAFNRLDLDLATRGQGAKGTDEQGFRLHIINAIWGQKDFKFQNDYLDLLAQDYGAGLRVLDFIKSTEDARQTINRWASDQTAGKIKDLLPPGSINNLTRMVLTNAIYFNAAWKYQFQKTATVNANFNLANGSQVSAPMMKQQESFAYGEGSDYQAVELPYDSNELSMVILLPKAGQFNTFEASFTGQRAAEIINGLKYSEVNLTLPRFTFSSDLSLKKALGEAGMTAAFSPSEADFSGMDGSRDLYIQDVIHQAYVAVDEKGTEAAAVTAVTVGTTAMPVDVKQMVVNRPFIFLIRDIPSGSILFLGRTMNPA
jgi:serpin B